MRPDGVEVKWEITTPTRWEEKKGTSRLPFFCGDVTPRELRVRAPVSVSNVNFPRIWTMPLLL
jgi:hypothetical protein